MVIASGSVFLLGDAPGIRLEMRQHSNGASREQAAGSTDQATMKCNRRSYNGHPLASPLLWVTDFAFSLFMSPPAAACFSFALAFISGSSFKASSTRVSILHSGFALLFNAAFALDLSPPLAAWFSFALAFINGSNFKATPHQNRFLGMRKIPMGLALALCLRPQIMKNFMSICPNYEKTE
jgi:hypothetical protein